MIMGTLSSYIKGLSLRHSAQERMNDPTKAKGKQSASFQRQVQQEQKNKQIGAITTKLKSGQRLSTKELEYLRRYAPGMYQKAVEIMEERKEYREGLRKSRTKEEVEQRKMQKLQQLSTELSVAKETGDTGKIEEIKIRMSHIFNEHNEFVSTREYQELPTEEELREEKKGKRKKSGPSAVRIEFNKHRGKEEKTEKASDLRSAGLSTKKPEGTRPTTEPTSDPRLPSERGTGSSRTQAAVPSGASSAASKAASPVSGSSGASSAAPKAAGSGTPQAPVKSFSIQA